MSCGGYTMCRWPEDSVFKPRLYRKPSSRLRTAKSKTCEPRTMQILPARARCIPGTLSDGGRVLSVSSGGASSTASSPGDRAAANADTR
eukprot:scaffold4079_cov250-Pinguiococcus_pyrenoidosus.AAC.5